MAYSTSSPPQLITQAIAGRRTWYYESADAAATVDTAGYITNAKQLGMQAGDIVLVYNTAGTILTTHLVASVNATTGVADLRDGTSVGVATNTD